MNEMKYSAAPCETCNHSKKPINHCNDCEPGNNFKYYERKRAEVTAVDDAVRAILLNGVRPSSSPAKAEAAFNFCISCLTKQGSDSCKNCITAVGSFPSNYRHETPVGTELKGARLCGNCGSFDDGLCTKYPRSGGPMRVANIWKACQIWTTSSTAKLYQEAIDLWGKDHQLRKAQEELLELALAISHYLDGRPNNISEEMADVEIVMEQLKLMFSTRLLEEQRAAKLAKFKAHIEAARGR